LPADAKFPGQLRFTHAILQPLTELGEGILRQRSLPALIGAPPFGQGNPFPLPFLYKSPFKLGERSHDGEEESGHRRIVAGKGEVLFDKLDFDALAGQGVDDPAQIVQVALNDARKPLATYLQHGGRDPESPYVFTSQREERLSEAGIHHWFRTPKAYATAAQWPLIAAITFHDLRHDFAHRVREAGWSLEEVAYYLGHVPKKGTPAIQTTARYTQVSREQVKAKFRQIRG
jgi:hypothetical protein